MFEIEQLQNGIQKKPYADHVYQWRIKSDLPEDEILEKCKELKKAPITAEEYYKKRRDLSMKFDKQMELICGGCYELKKESDCYIYTVTQEYID